MSDDEIKHLMDFILKQQAIFSSDMIELKNRDRERSQEIEKLATGLHETRALVHETVAFVHGTVAIVHDTAAAVQHLAAVVERLTEEAETNRQEMRQAIENLIVGNEATRELANRAAELAIHVSQRVTTREQKPHK